jgi:two-component system, OmpR family, phosphate regulon sensor histidine kinase PhoR
MNLRITLQTIMTFTLVVGGLLIRYLVSDPLPFLTIWLVSLSFVLFGIQLTTQLKLSKVNTQSKATTALDNHSLMTMIFAQLDPMVMVINQDGQSQYLTRSWKQLFQILELDKPSINAFRNAPTLWSTINQSLATERELQCEWELNKKIYQSKISPLIINGQFYGLLVTAFDITKISQLEKIQSDFLADISHEIKTPLAAILGASEILNQKQRKLTVKESNEFQSMIASESARLQRLIHELTDLSKIGTHGFQTLIKSTFSLKDLIKEIEQTFQIDLHKKNLKLNLLISDDVVAFADRDKFFLIFSNLISNAIRYTETGSITVKSETKNHTLVIEVIDTGLGIEPQNLERIFDRFYRTDAARSRNGGGSGLGLAITRAIIQAHQGAIQVKSEINKGTTFTITLPLPRLT